MTLGWSDASALPSLLGMKKSVQVLEHTILNLTLEQDIYAILGPHDPLLGVTSDMT